MFRPICELLGPFFTGLFLLPLYLPYVLLLLPLYVSLETPSRHSDGTFLFWLWRNSAREVRSNHFSCSFQAWHLLLRLLYSIQVSSCLHFMQWARQMYEAYTSFDLGWQTESIQPIVLLGKTLLKSQGRRWKGLNSLNWWNHKKNDLE